MNRRFIKVVSWCMGIVLFIDIAAFFYTWLIAGRVNGRLLAVCGILSICLAGVYASGLMKKR